MDTTDPLTLKYASQGNRRWRLAKAAENQKGAAMKGGMANRPTRSPKSFCAKRPDDLW